jgi:hypothetical protein
VAPKGLTFTVRFDSAALQAQYADLGDSYFRGVQFAIDETAKLAVTLMRAELPKALGRHDPGGWRNNPYRQKFFNYARSRKYSDFTNVESLTSEVFVNEDMSPFLKYGFGDGPTERRPGDVGLANDRILIPDAANLSRVIMLKGMAEHLGHGLIPADLMSKIHDRMGPDEFERALNGNTGHRDAMRRLATQARERHRFTNDAGLPAPRVGFTPGNIHGRTINERTGGVITIPRPRIFGSNPDAPPTVFRGPDRDGGMPTYMARPNRVRTTGTHAVMFAGHVARMPNMLNVPLRGARPGSKAGAYRLFHAARSVTMQPILQAPWDAAAERAYGEFPSIVLKELDQKRSRKAQGQSF